GLLLRVPSLSSPPKGLYNPRAFITHAAWLDQACAHCPIFPTAASRRSLGRVSVPVWLIILSDQLPIAALVGHYPTNKLIGRRLLPRRLAPLDRSRHAVLATVSRGYPPPKDRYLRVTHPSATDRLPCPCDLHVLSMPPAFALSQDQTLRFIDDPPGEPGRPDEQTRTLSIYHLRPKSAEADLEAYCNALSKMRRQQAQ